MDSRSSLEIIDQMRDLQNGMDIIIVSTSTPFQEEYWQSRLETFRGILTPANSLLIAVHEDWTGGAGNGLGSLYAYQKAAQKCKELYDKDLDSLLKNDASVALYHTAGQGTRLAPLTISEYCNKSAVRLPGLLEKGVDSDLITVLEAVIRQTSVYAPSRKGRLSVFWGDQIFIPTTIPKTASAAPIDILAINRKFPLEQEWNQQNLSSYGLIALGKNQRATLLDKCDYSTIKNLIDTGRIDCSEGIGTSLGSFSVSYKALQALLNEYSTELSQKNQKMDSDPHFLMPATLDFQTYFEVMTQKGESEDVIRKQFKRMQQLKLSLAPDGILAAVDIGLGGYWWDYGTAQAYYKNNLKLVEDHDEAEAMRRFFGVKDRSGVINSDLKDSNISHSVVAGVKTKKITAKDSVIIRSIADEIAAEGSLIYRINEAAKIISENGEVYTDFYNPNNKERIRLSSTLDRDGKKDWPSRYQALSELCQQIRLIPNSP